MEINNWLNEFLYIAGPCAAESKKQLNCTAKGIAKNNTVVQYFRAGIWKPRTQPGAFEGLGAKALPLLKNAAENNDMIPCLEVANAEQVEAALNCGIDHFWIGARTSGDPFSVEDTAAAIENWYSAQDEKVTATVFVKNPMCADLDLWIGAMMRLNNHGVTRLGAIFRGIPNCNEKKYRNSPDWSLVMKLKNRIPNLPIVCDISHIAGKREYLDDIADQAMQIGVNGFMIETHCDPAVAMTDAKQQVTPEDLQKLIDRHQQKSANSDALLVAQRLQIDYIDRELFALLNKRFDITNQIGKIKKENNIAVYQQGRVDDIRQKLDDSLKTNVNLNKAFVDEIFELIHDESVKQQMKI